MKLNNQWALLTGLLVTLFLLPLQANPDKGWLGVGIEEMTPTMRDAMKLGNRDGLLVNSVSEDSPANKAGLKADDIILSYNGTKTNRVQDLIDLVRATAPGTAVKLVYMRDGAEETTEVLVAKRKRRKTDISWFSPDGDGKMMFFSDRPMLGVKLQVLDKDLAGYFSGAREGSVLITEVVSESAAAKAGLLSGDIITSIDGKEISGPQAVEETLEEYETGDKLQIGYLRKGKTGKAEATLQAGEHQFGRHFFHSEGGGADPLKMFFREEGEVGEPTDVEVIIRNRIEDVRKKIKPRKIALKTAGEATI